MKEPILMPFQDSEFNGDHFISAEFIKLRDRFNISTVIETGTCLGYTTLWLAKNFDKVYTIELNKEYCELARAKFLQYPNITSIHGNSEDVLRHLRIETMNSLWSNVIFFLDAHGFGAKRCPLITELYSIYKMGLRPIIAIHDFYVPGSELGYDTYNGQRYDLKWIERSLRQIYGSDKNYKIEYNSDSKSVGAKRGIAYIYPNLIA